MCQLHLFLHQDDLFMVTHSLVTSQLDYCNVLYLGLPLKSTQKFRWVWNAAIFGSNDVCFFMSCIDCQVVLGSIQSAGVDLQNPSWHGTGFCGGAPLTNLIYLSDPTERAWYGFCCLRSYLWAFSAVVPTFWRLLLPEVKLTLSMLSFRRSRKPGDSKVTPLLLTFIHLF